MNKNKKIISTLGSYAGLKSRKTPSFSGFDTTWKTDNPGTSNNNQIMLPLNSDGNYNFEVLWGDGTYNKIIKYDDPEVTHTYVVPGTYTINIRGVLDGWKFNNGGDREKILTVDAWGDLLVGDGGSYFRGCSYLVVNATDNLNLSNVTNMDKAFHTCSSLVTFDVRNWDVSNVNDFKYCFYRCSKLVYIDVSLWDVGNVTSFDYTFGYCNLLNNLDVSLWNVQNVIHFSYTFYNCSCLSSLDVSNWVTSSCISLAGTFNGCSLLETLNLNTWDVRLVASIGHCFDGCTKLVNVYVSEWNTEVNDELSYAFKDCTSLHVLEIGNWDITNVKKVAGDMVDMFLNVTLETTYYDFILIGWESQAVQNNVIFHGGNSKYTLGGAAEAARTALINDHFWQITDGGGI